MESHLFVGSTLGMGRTLFGRFYLLNTYAYVGGNPVNAIDPFGLTIIFTILGRKCCLFTQNNQVDHHIIFQQHWGRPNGKVQVFVK